MENIRIEKIFIHNNYLYAKVSSGNFDKVYRSGISVSWDEETSALYYNGRETTNDNKVDIIIKAVSNEYRINLIIDESTIVEI